MASRCLDNLASVAEPFPEVMKATRTTPCCRAWAGTARAWDARSKVHSSACPLYDSKLAGGTQLLVLRCLSNPASMAEPIPEHNKGYAMLQSMVWKGQGLGRQK